MSASRNSGEVDTSPKAPVQRSSFYQENFWFVWSCLRRLGVATADLEDATHDAFLVAHRRRAELASASSPRGWLFGVVRRVASNHRRGVGRHDRRLAAVRDVGPRATRPERDLERTDAARVVRRFLDGLDEPRRNVFVLSELQQMTAKEVAQLLDINPNTASARLRSARKAFDRFAEDVRTENGWDGRAAVAELQQTPRPSREARKRVGSALAVSLASAPGRVAAPGLAGFAKAAGLALALGGGAVGMIAGVARLTHEPSSTATVQQPTADASTHPPSTTPPEAPESEAPPPPSDTIGGLAHEDTWAEPASDISAPDQVPARRAAAAPSTTKPTPAPSSNAPKTASPSTAASLQAQTLRFGQARAAQSRGNAAAALRLAADYRERFPAGVFLTELEIIEIRAHCTLGDTPRARAQRERFMKAHPGSPHLAVIDETCAGSVTKTGSGGD
ncbi:MAG: sigma-70 family RNA polymerase sigma factor [Myxococcota bacterium]